MGAINPCHTPAQNLAGLAPGCLYFELVPATASGFAIRFLSMILSHSHTTSVYFIGQPLYCEKPPNIENNNTNSTP